VIRLFIVFGKWLKFENVLSGNFILLIKMINSNYDNNSCWKKVKKTHHLIFFFFNFTHKGQKYLTIIEHIFYFIIPFSCQNLSSIHAFVLHTNRLQVDADYILELGFSSRDFGSKYHNLYSTTPCLIRPFFRTPFNGRYRQVWLYNLFDQVLINVITFVLFSLYLNRS
jgi:hypothetical protein